MSMDGARLAKATASASFGHSAMIPSGSSMRFEPLRFDSWRGRGSSCSSAMGLLASVSRRRLIHPQDGRRLSSSPFGLIAGMDGARLAAPKGGFGHSQKATGLLFASSPCFVGCAKNNGSRLGSHYFWYTFRGSNPGHPD